MQFCYLYIFTNVARTYLYIGATDDLTQKLEEHKLIACSSFSKEIHATHLIYFETFSKLSLAESRVAEIKKWKESQKWRLIMRANPCLSELLWLDSETTAA
ncbi:GIY-YIG nuclease family protein [Flavobacterium sp. MAH-1]|uniref:GIY-YIG nuclease family protein n=1 Tax=Flavobacterium agri TaxID=2743471 RepID=A0A7Y8Y198_9FLAO|nr:GIY-YIG nuclease family protein [Flavobacterium agri]NUY80679.1 GIY-YIG nuclease family protein [Flavobacterium agri]NYA70703.1 GIY-YIG nuclease family protein [Flavobacterium agri]